MNPVFSYLNKLSRKNVIILGILLLFTVWINNILSNALNYNDLNLDEKISNHFINKFKMNETNVDGVISWTLQGDKLEKFPNSLRSEVINPVMEINSTEELEIIKKFSDKSKDALDIGVYRGVYSFQLARYFNFVHSFEPNPLLFPYLNKNLKKILNNIQLYNYALSDSNGDTKLKLPIRSESIFKNNIEELYKLGAASIHSKNKFTN